MTGERALPVLIRLFDFSASVAQFFDMSVGPNVTERNWSLTDRSGLSRLIETLSPESGPCRHLYDFSISGDKKSTTTIPG